MFSRGFDFNVDLNVLSTTLISKKGKVKIKVKGCLWGMPWWVMAKRMGGARERVKGDLPRRMALTALAGLWNA